MRPTKKIYELSEHSFGVLAWVSLSCGRKKGGWKSVRYSSSLPCMDDRDEMQ